MAIAIVGTPVTVENDAAPATTLGSGAISMTAGSLIVVTATMFSGNTPTVADNVNGSYTQDIASTANGDTGWKTYIFSKANVAGGSTTVTMTQGSGLYAAMTVYELSGAATASALDVTGEAQGPDAQTVNLSTAANSCIIAAGGIYTNSNTVTPGTNFTEQAETDLPTAGGEHYDEYWLDVGSAGSKAVTYTPSLGFAAKVTLAAAAYKIAGGGGGSTILRVVGGGVGNAGSVIC